VATFLNTGPTGTLMKCGFSEAPKNFTKPDPYDNIASTRLVKKLGYDEEEGYYYYNLNYWESAIYFNATPEFLYNSDKYPPHTEISTTLIKKGWVTQEYLDNLKDVPKDVKIFSFLQVAIHEIGHMLEFNHYNTGDLYGNAKQYCDNGGIEVDGIMKYNTNDARKENITELCQYDKCMMANYIVPI
jgi:antitoxin component YwqK of YwqJK toxin-antitoxin module